MVASILITLLYSCLDVSSPDPYQLRNVAFTLTNQRLAELHHRLESLRTCSGAAQCDNIPMVQVLLPTNIYSPH